jgi:hypothetical protein
LNITCNFLYCNHQVHKDFLITLYDLCGETLKEGGNFEDVGLDVRKILQRIL